MKPSTGRRGQSAGAAAPVPPAAAAPPPPRRLPAAREEDRVEGGEDRRDPLSPPPPPGLPLTGAPDPLSFERWALALPSRPAWPSDWPCACAEGMCRWR